MGTIGAAGRDGNGDGEEGPRLIGVELVVLELALRRPVGTADGTHDLRPVLFARVVTDRGEGWGECGALSGGTSVDASLESVREQAVALVVPRLLAASAARGGVVPEAAQLPGITGSGSEERLAGAMLEMALLDAELKTTGQSLGEYLGSAGASAPVGAMVGIPAGRDVGALLGAVDEVLDPSSGGAARLRLKIAPGWDVVPVEAVRSRHPSLLLLADANGAYRATTDGPESSRRLAALEPFDLACVEQPFPASDLVSHAQLTAELGIAVCLDESLTSLRHVEDALRYGAMGVACLKPPRLGGLSTALEARNRCVAAGVQVFVGGFFETGLGRSANLALAGGAGGPGALPGDLTEPRRYLGESPFSYPQVRDGQVAVPDGPGIGAVVDPEAFDRLAVWREWFSAGPT
jgi:O-succinylbenzoate synthase